MERTVWTRRGLMKASTAGSAITLAQIAMAATSFCVGDKDLIALSDGYFDMPASMPLGMPETLHAEIDGPARIAAYTYAYRTGSPRLADPQKASEADRAHSLARNRTT